jgi:hypothetical protein
MSITTHCDDDSGSSSAETLEFRLVYDLVRAAMIADVLAEVASLDHNAAQSLTDDHGGRLIPEESLDQDHRFPYEPAVLLAPTIAVR